MIITLRQVSCLGNLRFIFCMVRFHQQEWLKLNDTSTVRLSRHGFNLWKFSFYQTTCKNYEVMQMSLNHKSYWSRKNRFNIVMLTMHFFNLFNVFSLGFVTTRTLADWHLRCELKERQSLSLLWGTVLTIQMTNVKDYLIISCRLRIFHQSGFDCFRCISENNLTGNIMTSERKLILWFFLKIFSLLEIWKEVCFFLVIIKLWYVVDLKKNNNNPFTTPWESKTSRRVKKTKLATKQKI